MALLRRSASLSLDLEFMDHLAIFDGLQRYQAQVGDHLGSPSFGFYLTMPADIKRLVFILQ